MLCVLLSIAKFAMPFVSACDADPRNAFQRSLKVDSDGKPYEITACPMKQNSDARIERPKAFLDSYGFVMKTTITACTTLNICASKRASSNIHPALRPGADELEAEA